MKTLIYPAIFEKDLEDGGFSIYFPDLKGVHTEGETIEESIANAKEALGLWMSVYLEKNKTAPKITPLEKLKCDKNSFVQYIELDPLYLKEILTKSTKVNVSLPTWLKSAAEKKGINFSQALQEALKEKLGV